MLLLGETGTGKEMIADAIHFSSPRKDGPYIHLDALVGKDPRFLFFDPDRPDRNYNDNANELLVRAIREGHRGVYWGILRRGLLLCPLRGLNTLSMNTKPRSLRIIGSIVHWPRGALNCNIRPARSTFAVIISPGFI